MTVCGAIRECSRPKGHRGQHGGFRPLDVDEILTPRERDVLRLVALGRTWGQITRELGISRHTLYHHRGNATSKVGGGSTIDVLREIGWLRVPA